MKISANGLSIEVDDQGPPSGQAILMIMGLGMQLVAWPDELVNDLLGRGYRVIRFDNRDIGLSQHFDDAGAPNLAWAGLRHVMHLKQHSPYGLCDMAADAIGVLDALGVARAHVCGASMGGMIAQHLAAENPERVRSLTLIMTTAGARNLPQPSMAVRQAMLGRPDGQDMSAVVAHLQRLLSVIGSAAYPPDPQRQQRLLLAAAQRSWHPQGTARQLLAVMADGDRTPLLARIGAPTFVIHGEADPLIPVAAGHHLLQHIRGAEGDFIAGMGHDLPLPLLPRIAAGIAGCAARAAN
ncbi:MAG: alpha/beta fold hydrolase [Rubrivivax sp.]|nr:alpha/beta fold hydrolase [Rubrivivax sp.]MBK7262990.1 alpha/beta fold hydrolase [Rubrivivax sp.]